ncbi:MAG: hypothetical protein IIZ75_08635, partial [Lachnospiraceae bacterium]|nr:hypothetical protein [Lachnospiraceae bacterium]
SEEKVKAYFGISDKKKGLFESFTDIEELNAPKEPVVKEEKAAEKEPAVEEKAEKAEEKKAAEKEPVVEEEKAEKVEEKKAVEKEPAVEEKKAEKVEEKKVSENEQVVEEEKAEKVEEKKAVEKEPAVEEKKAEKVEEKKASEKEQDVKEEKAEQKAKINENDEELDDLDDFEVQPVEKEKKAGEAEVKAEKKAEKVVEKKALMNADNYYEIPFTKYDVKTDITGMDAVYESQGANNCYAVTGTALLNHFISRKKGEKQVVKRYDQWNMRNFKPQVRKYDPNNKAGLDIVAYNSSVKNLASYAGEGKEEFGSLFDMGDFLMEKLAENEIENVMLNRYNITVPEVDAKEAKEKEETKLRNYRALFTDKISRIITEGGVAGVLITERGYSHYVTITGIKDDELTVYDSSGYKGKAKTVKLDSLIKRGRGLEINWLSDIKEPQEMEKEYPNLKHDADKGYQVKAETFEDFYPSIGLTGGVVVSKDADGNAEGIEDVTQMAYIPVKNMQVEKKQLGDAAQEVSEWEQAQKEAERREAERKAAEQFDTSVNTLFGEIFKGRNKLPEILNDINYSFKREKDEKPYYNRMRSALLRIQKLAEKVGDVKKAPLTQELMDAVTVLSESANAYFDEHRGTQISTRGSRRKIGCESLRDLVKEFYDRLDRKTGGKGLGNVTESNMPYGVSKKEADDAPNKLAELVKNYDKWKKHFADREGLDRVTVRDKAHLFAVYERDIAIYKALVPIKKRPEAIDEIIRTADLYKLQNATITKFEEMHSGFSDPISKLARAHADAMDERPEPEKELKKKEIDKGLTNEQLKAVDDIDQWFIRNYSNAGWVGWAVGARNHHGEAVSNLLSKTKRERLFIYYLIETKKRKAPELYDVFVSQTDYIPDLAKFKKRMVSHWLKVISHLSGEYVAMHKLSEASQINREYQQIVKSCSDPVTADKYVDLTKLKEDKVAYRAYMLEQVFKSTKACKDKSEELLKKQKNKKEVKPDAELIELRKKAAADLKELIAADVAVGEAEKYGELTEEGKIKSNNIYNPANSNVGDLSTNTKYYAKYGAKAAENTGTVVKGAVEGVNLVQQGVEKIIPSASGMGEWKLKDSFLANTDFFAGNVTAGGISAVGGLLAAAYGIYSLTRGTSNMHAGDIGANVVKILNSGASAVTTVIKGVEATEQYISAADKVLQGTLTVSPALKIAGTVTAGVSTGLETYNTVSGLLDRRNAAKASSYLKKKNAGEETKDTKQAKFEKNMLKVSKDISAKKTRSGGLGTLGSGLSVAGLFVPVAGTALTFVGLGITMISGAVNIFGYDIKRIRKTMFDSYFGFDAFLKEAELLVQAQGQEIYDKKEFRKRMRRTLAASAGFSDVGSACDHVAKKYSDYICAKLFGGEGERSTDENERNAFIQLIKSFGLPYNEEKQIPSADALARKMNGR